MFGKLAEVQRKAEEIKQKLDAISVIAEESGVTVTATANRKVIGLKIGEEYLQPDRKNDLEQTLIDCINKAMEQAETVSSAEMKALMGSMLPGMGNLFGK